MGFQKFQPVCRGFGRHKCQKNEQGFVDGPFHCQHGCALVEKSACQAVTDHVGSQKTAAEVGGKADQKTTVDGFRRTANHGIINQQGDQYMRTNVPITNGQQVQ